MQMVLNDGKELGNSDGIPLVTVVGILLGWRVGKAEDIEDDITLGYREGKVLGTTVGTLLGSKDGKAEGILDGN